MIGRTATLAIGASLLGLVVAFGRRKPAAQLLPMDPVGPPPVPADFPTRPGGYKAANPVTPELTSIAKIVLASGAPIGTLEPFAIGDDDKEYASWVTYHAQGNKWVRAVEILERV